MFQKVLYPTDFSDVSEKAMDYLRQLRDGGAKEIIVLHVMDERTDEMLKHVAGAEILERLETMKRQSVDESLKKIEERLKSWGFAVTIQVKKGLPFREILKTEKEEKVSIIVIGSHGMSNVEEILIGSVSEKVIRKSTRPVLVVKR